MSPVGVALSDLQPEHSLDKAPSPGLQVRGRHCCAHSANGDHHREYPTNAEEPKTVANQQIRRPTARRLEEGNTPSCRILWPPSPRHCDVVLHPSPVKLRETGPDAPEAGSDHQHERSFDQAR